MGFTGEYIAKLNSKNQVTLPSSLREAVFASSDLKKTTLVLFQRGKNNFLELYLGEEWKRIQERTELIAKQQKKPELNLVLNSKAHSFPLEKNGNGRLLIPQMHVDYFKPDGDIVFIGNTKKIELWNAEIYKAFKQDAESSFVETLGDIFDY